MFEIKKTNALILTALACVLPMTGFAAETAHFSLESESEYKHGHKEFVDLIGYESQSMQTLMQELFPEFPMASERFDNSLPNLLMANLVLSKGRKWENIMNTIYDLSFSGRLPHNVIYSAAMALYNDQDKLSDRGLEIMVELQLLAQVHAEITDHYIKINPFQFDTAQEGPAKIFRSKHFKRWTYGDAVLAEEYPNACFRALSKFRRHYKTIQVPNAFPMGYSPLFFENFRVREIECFSQERVKAAIDNLYNCFVDEVNTLFPEFDYSEKRASEFDFNSDHYVTDWWR